ncbi:MAG: hypothetical protein KF857_03790 [Fimbriimonadaceae bacterium]|nr:hypothetical protein [Fimbriimonadaceae bacterium]
MVTIRSEILAEQHGAEGITLENPFVRVTLAPAMGRPIVSLYDKRSGTELIPAGRTVAIGDPADTGGWNVQVREPVGQGGAGAVSLFRISASLETDTWAVVSLGPDDAWVKVDVQAHGRSLVAVPVPDMVTLPDGLAAHGLDNGTAVVVGHDGAGALVDCVRPPDGVRWPLVDVTPAVLLGGRTVAGHIALAPHGGLGEVHGTGTDWVAAWRPDGMEVVAQRDVGEVELHVETESGETLKASVRLAAAVATVVSTSGLPPVKRAALVDKSTCLGWIETSPVRPSTRPAMTPSAATAAWTDSHRPTAEPEFRRISATWEACAESPADLPAGLPGTEHVVATAKAVKHARAAAWALADEAVDQALVTNGDDALLWWAKAAVARHQGEDDEALPNAHFLSPMEPMLRVEAFLRQDQAQGSEPNPLVAPVALDARAARDCLARLGVWGFWADFARLADELLRHRDDAAVRYMLAWSLATRTRMRATAAEHVGKAALLPVETGGCAPPLLHTAVSGLARAFPEDVALQGWQDGLGPVS